MPTVSPVNDSRPSRQGKIKWAQKGPKGFPVGLEHFRLTSPDRTALEALAQVYGGEPRQWDDTAAAERNQWELLTTSKELNVWIVPGQMYKGYEHWQGGTCMRRCDGEECELLTPNPDGDEYRPAPCLCDAADELTCKPKVRASFILPDAPLGGTWMMESSAWNVWRGMPAMSEMLEMLQGANAQLQPARLILTEKSKKVRKAGKVETRRWREPQLILPATASQILSGEAGVGQIAAPSIQQVELSSPAHMVASIGEMDEVEMGEKPDTLIDRANHVIDAEIVSEEEWPTKAAAIAAGLTNSEVTKAQPGKWVRK
jgi:hypothetical protein